MQRPLYQSMGHEALSQVIDIDLYSGIVDLVTSTSTEITSAQKTAIKTNLYYRSEAQDIQNAYNIKYLGELLERYEEKVGASDRTIRAIALALAHTQEIVTDNMFVGTQRKNFMRRIQKLAKDDVYIRCALYQLDKTSIPTNDTLADTAFPSTLSLIVSLSEFGAQEDVIGTLRLHLESLLGRKRDLPAFHNIKIYAWLIGKLAPFLAKTKPRNTPTLKALVMLATGNAKPESKAWTGLSAAGYSQEEIAYLNHAMMLYQPVPGTVRRSSITGVKISIQFVRTMLSSTLMHSENTFEYLTWVINSNSPLPIKVAGHNTMYEAVCETQMCNAQTFIWFFHLIEKYERYSYAFDPLDETWDELPAKLRTDEYRKLFDVQLERLSDDGKTAERVAKYESLIGIPFIDTFVSHDNQQRRSVFDLLVREHIIDPITLFDERFPDLETIKKATAESTQGFIANFRMFIRGIRTRDAFLLTKHILSIYAMSDVLGLFYADYHQSFADGMFVQKTHGYGPHSTHSLKLEQDFLRISEMRELIGWLDECVYLTNPAAYPDLCTGILESEHLDDVLPFEERRELFFAMQNDNKRSSYKFEQLKRKYMTDDELKREKDEKARRDQEAAIATATKEREEAQAKFNEMCGDGTLLSFWEFSEAFRYYQTKKLAALMIVLGELKNTVLDGHTHSLGNDTFIAIKLLCAIERENILSQAEAARYIANLCERMLSNDGREITVVDPDEQAQPVANPHF